MLSPILAVFFALWSGGAVIPCSSKLTFSVNYQTNSGELWQFTCSDRWSEDSSLHFLPNGTTTLSANCYDNPKPLMQFKAYDTKGRYLYSASSSLTQIIWQCNNDPKKFDSTFNVAAENVGTSPIFWAVFSLSLGAGMYVGAARRAVADVEAVVLGGEKDE